MFSAIQRNADIKINRNTTKKGKAFPTVFLTIYNNNNNNKKRKKKKKKMKKKKKKKKKKKRKKKNNGNNNGNNHKSNYCSKLYAIVQI